MDSARDFHHPFQPYDIQIQFMSAVYNCIEQRKVGILESPTGTVCVQSSILSLSPSTAWQILSYRCTFSVSDVSIMSRHV